MKTTILSWLQNDGTRGFSVDQLIGNKLLPTFQPDALVIFRTKVNLYSDESLFPLSWPTVNPLVPSILFMFRWKLLRRNFNISLHCIPLKYHSVMYPFDMQCYHATVCLGWLCDHHRNPFGSHVCERVISSAKFNWTCVFSGAVVTVWDEQQIFTFITKTGTYSIDKVYMHVQWPLRMAIWFTAYTALLLYKRGNFPCLLLWKYWLLILYNGSRDKLIGYNSGRMVCKWTWENKSLFNNNIYLVWLPEGILNVGCYIYSETELHL